MIIVTRKCPHCDSESIRKNGIEPLNGKQKYKCLSCNRYGTLGAAPKYSDEKNQLIMNAYFERPSMRGIEIMFNVSRHTLSSWLKKSAALPENTSLSACILDVPSDDMLEFDKVHSYVKKTNYRWLWTAISQKTKKIVAFYKNIVIFKVRYYSRISN